MSRRGGESRQGRDAEENSSAYAADDVSHLVPYVAPIFLYNLTLRSRTPDRITRSSLRRRLTIVYQTSGILFAGRTPIAGADRRRVTNCQ
jgi:hypothetical protein